MTTETRETASESSSRIVMHERHNEDLMSDTIRKEMIKINKMISESAGSNTVNRVGEIKQPFSFESAKGLVDYDEHHAACIDTKISACVGLGFLTNKEKAKIIAEPGTVLEQASEDESVVEEQLDDLCTESFMHVLTDVCEDFYSTGNGYFEIIRRDPAAENSPIIGIHHLPADQVTIVALPKKKFYYKIGASADDQSEDVFFARFGHAHELLQDENLGLTAENMAEVIHIKQPSARNRWYGIPTWLSAIVPIELKQCLKQYKYDFFNNRGVPEILISVTGGTLDAKSWAKLENVVKASIGLGNTQKSAAINIDNPDIKFDIHKLGAESKAEDDYDPVTNALALQIISGHGVPPLLAGIMIPGKLGASNELPNAMMAFQQLRVAKSQKVFTGILGKTLGNKERNGGEIKLQKKDFQFKNILHVIDLKASDTMSKMKEPIAGSGRDLKEGLKD